MFDPNDAKQLALEIEKIYKRIGLSNPFSSGVHTVAELKNGLEEARDILLEWDEGVGDIERGFRAILNEVNTTGNSFNMVKRSLTSITSISAQIRDHQLGINQLTSKQLTQYKSKLASEAATLSNNVKELQDERDLLAARTTLGTAERARLAQLNTLIANTNGLLQDQDSIQKLLNEKLDQEIYQRETIEKKLGVVGGMLRGISKIPILGDLVDTNEALHVAESTIELTESSVRGLGAAMGNLGKQVISGLLNPANLVLGAFTIMAKVLKDVDKGAGDFAKSMNITYGEALGVRSEMNAMAMSSGDAALNSERLLESLGYINQQLGTNGKLSEQDLKTFSKLREQSGLTNEQLFSMQKYTMATGGTLKENISTFQATSKILSYQNKVSLNTKQLMVDMGNVSNRTKLSIEGGVKGLAEAAVKAKLMGSNLEQVSSIADQLLNFESSIEAELSAELLTGRDITLEKARQAALNNDLATVSSEITRQIGSAAEYGDMNRIQQEAMAKAVGMTADQLADVLFEQEALSKLGRKLSDEEERAFNAAKEKYGLEQASKMLTEKQLKNLTDQQSIQDRFNDSVLKLKDIFVQLSVPILQIVSPIADFVGLLTSLGSGILPTIIGGFVTLKALSMSVMLLSKSKAAFDLLSLGYQTALYGIGKKDLTLQAARNIAKGEELATQIGIAAAWAVANPFKALLGVGIAAAAVGTIYSLMKGNDVVSAGEGTGYGNRTLLMGKDAIQLNNKDTVIAGTNLFGGKQNQSTTVDNSSLIAEIRALRNELNSRPVVVHSTVQLPNGEVLARATNSENRKIHYGVQ